MLSITNLIKCSFSFIDEALQILWGEPYLFIKKPNKKEKKKQFMPQELETQCHI